MVFEPDKLRAARLTFNPPHSQEMAAKMMGVSWISVNRWENGKSYPSGLYLKAVERYIEQAKKAYAKVVHV
jgi:DNA-binding transcriptional regulator YiaG